MTCITERNTVFFALFSLSSGFKNLLGNNLVGCDGRKKYGRRMRGHVNNLVALHDLNDDLNV